MPEGGSDRFGGDRLARFPRGGVIAEGEDFIDGTDRDDLLDGADRQALRNDALGEVLLGEGVVELEQRPCVPRADHPRGGLVQVQDGPILRTAGWFASAPLG